MKPSNLLIYYGWLNSFNSAVNQWNNEKVSQEMAKYDLLVFGAGLQDPSHGDYANTVAIINRIKVLNSNTLIFGYVTTKETLANFQTKTTQWNTLGIHGIFLDEAGYDYGTIRTDFNTRVDYVHNRSSVKKCFVNAWNEDHIIGVVNDPSYPNSTYNSGSTASKLNSNDWYLLESFAVNTDFYTGNNGYCDKATWSTRGDKAVARRTTFALKAAAVGIVNDSNVSGQALHDFAYRSALAYELDGHGTSDTSYGAGTAASKWWDRPSPRGIPQAMTGVTVVADANDSDVYMRYTNNMKVLVDHSIGAQTSSIVQW